MQKGFQEFCLWWQFIRQTGILVGKFFFIYIHKMLHVNPKKHTMAGWIRVLWNVVILLIVLCVFYNMREAVCYFCLFKESPVADAMAVS